MTYQSELDRIKTEYTRRNQNKKLSELYTVFNPGNLFTLQNQERALLKALKHKRYTNLSDLKILDIGSGTGYNLLNLIRYGARPGNLIGLDLMAVHSLQSRMVLPNSLHVQANAGELPFPDQTFDLVFMYTVLTSVLDPQLKRAIAAQAQRVVTQAGLILIYDFKKAGKSDHIKGVSTAEIKSLFPKAKIEFQTITLAMGITWRLAPHSWLLCTLLERIPWLKTHYLATIHL